MIHSGFPGVKAAAEMLTRVNGVHPIVVDGSSLQRNPRATLMALRSHLGIDYDERMMKWAMGGSIYDGCWASWWYGNVHNSTGFNVAGSTSDHVNTNDRIAKSNDNSDENKTSILQHNHVNDLSAIMEECTRIYTDLMQYALPDTI